MRGDVTPTPPARWTRPALVPAIVTIGRSRETIATAATNTFPFRGVSGRRCSLTVETLKRVSSCRRDTCTASLSTAFILRTSELELLPEIHMHEIHGIFTVDEY